MKLFSLTLAAALALPALAETVTVKQFDYYGPFALKTPLMVDNVDVNGKEWNAASLAPAPKFLSLSALPKTSVEPATAPGSDSPEVHVLAFSVTNGSYATPTISVDGIKDYDVYVDGVKSSSKTFTLKPDTHNIAIRYVADSTPAEALNVKLASDTDAKMTLRHDGKRDFNLADVLHGTRVRSAQLSPDGKYLITTFANTRRGGKSSGSWRVSDAATGSKVLEITKNISWMPSGSRFYYTRPASNGLEIVVTDAATGNQNVIETPLEEGTYFSFTPDEKSLVYTTFANGRQEEGGVYEIINPEDRQPGWRTRSSLALLDLRTGVSRPLTFGHRNVSLLDIAPDSRHVLFSTSQSRLEKRPTTLFSLFSLDLETMKADTLNLNDGFMGGAIYSPDGTQVLAGGTPQAFNEIGKNVPEGRIPSMTDNQLYLIDIKSKKVTPLTKFFNPSVSDFKWSAADGQIYLSAENRDQVNLFTINPANGKAKLIATPLEIVSSFSLPDAGRNLAVVGEGANTPNSLYLLDTKTGRSTLLDSPQSEALADVKLSTCQPWDFVSSRGDTICGRFYLPADFDPSKKYPLIVNYYGGCSPTSRNFEGRYPHHAYASQGYVVYVIEPSGATGFGQEFSSRHVNTAGQGVAEDIIEGTQEFCRQHPYVNDKKIGCIGASYGGFMTQYLQTVTPIFAAAISHAGISDHTSYWGEGYWGYSYSEVSMAESYPWTRKDLYVDQSPLFNAHKVNTPILFLHGDADNNVPVGESIQMFTALKLLGKPTAFVAVADQDHHILDYDKRIKWQDTIFAWFARHLKDDSSWWDALYPPTPL